MPLLHSARKPAKRFPLRLGRAIYRSRCTGPLLSRGLCWKHSASRRRGEENIQGLERTSQRRKERRLLWRSRPERDVIIPAFCSPQSGDRHHVSVLFPAQLIHELFDATIRHSLTFGGQVQCGVTVAIAITGNLRESCDPSSWLRSFRALCCFVPSPRSVLCCATVVFPRLHPPQNFWHPISMSDSDEAFSDELLELAGATDKKRKRRQNGVKGSKRRKAECVLSFSHLSSIHSNNKIALL